MVGLHLRTPGQVPWTAVDSHLLERHHVSWAVVDSHLTATTAGVTYSRLLCPCRICKCAPTNQSTGTADYTGDYAAAFTVTSRLT